MGHPFRLREIARQAGLSEATVDRVLNGRGGVRAETTREVHRAIDDLHRQRTQLRLAGRTFLIDVVMQTPERFSSAVRAALEAELPFLRPAAIRARFHFTESGPASDLVETLGRIRRRGSHGVVLKAPDTPEVVAAADALVRDGVPVLTLVTDLGVEGRIAYVGIDNRAAGETAAYLVDQWLHGRPGSVLVTLSRGWFRGEEQRVAGFRAAIGRREVVEVDNTDGLDATMQGLVLSALDRTADAVAVYSVGGANPAILDAFAVRDRRCAVFVAHDLDTDNARLLRDRRISAVLHHDLRQDMRRACHYLLQAHGALPGPVRPRPSTIQVITPYNLP
ncbi:LacI family DNA-binding transcriptional regulator [Cryptosporangium sp. NPDC051539]|uniref:LacI family DNA-binding transcriptional regulator n=1 Tax=Cryptosporangium sp. NPDC051539 TaxID=3363962 RepID=UPI00378CC61A